MTGPWIDLSALERAPVADAPFRHVVVPGFVPEEAAEALERDYPSVPAPGSFPLFTVKYGPAFRAFVDAIEGPDFARALGAKLGLDLAGRPTMITVRGRARAGDGQIHTDSKTKVVTVLIYMNRDWSNPGGRLRLLRSKRLDDYVAEVPPQWGVMLAFVNGPTAWHGHESFEGERRVIQLNWVTSEAVVRREQFRHGVSARLKRLKGLFGRRAA
jgi:SM-20-related protein